MYCLLFSEAVKVAGCAVVGQWWWQGGKVVKPFAFQAFQASQLQQLKRAASRFIKRTRREEKDQLLRGNSSSFFTPCNERL